MEYISLENISFSYGKSVVISSANAKFYKDSFVAVTGESGVGKSTLLNIMSGILSPSEGRINVVTCDGESYDVAKCRKMFAYVPQDFLLLSGNVSQNITLFDDSPDKHRLEEAVRISELSEVVEELPNGFDTFLGEGGGRLSGGQRQRMAIARAVYSGAQVLLMDESTSALSDTIEKRIIQNLRKSGKTVIIVTHRRSAAELCDMEYRIEYGGLTINSKQQN